MRTEHLDQASFCPFALREVSVLAELALGHLRYSLTDVPPQSNSPPGSVLEPDHAGVVRRNAVADATPLCTLGTKHRAHADIIDRAPLPPNRVSNETMKVVVFQRRSRETTSHLCYTSHVSLQCQTRVKLNRVFFPR
jgi:hypothetical protein